LSYLYALAAYLTHWNDAGTWRSGKVSSRAISLRKVSIVVDLASETYEKLGETFAIPLYKLTSPV